MDSTIIAAIIGLLGTISAAYITARAKDKSYEENLRQQKLSYSPKPTHLDYGINIESPKNGERVGKTINIRGKYNELPPDSTLQIFTISKDRLYRPQQEARVRLDKTSKLWHASLSAESIEMKSGESKTIGIALMGEAGEVLCQYFWKAGQLAKQYPGIDNLTPDVVFHGEVTVTRE